MRAQLRLQRRRRRARRARGTGQGGTGLCSAFQSTELARKMAALQSNCTSAQGPRVLTGLRRAVRRALPGGRATGSAAPSMADCVPPVQRSAAGAGWYSRDEAIMGTAIRVELWCSDRAAADEAMAAVMAQMHHVDRTMSPHKPDSALSHINRDAGAHAVPLDDEMYGLLERAQHFSRISGGAFDITFASVGRLYDYRAGVRPHAAALAHARSAIGYQYLVLDPAARTVRFARPGMCIDLGGFAKGYAVESAAAILRARGIANAIVTAGGDSRILGDRRGRPWAIGVRDPRRPGELAAVLPLCDAAVSTSGDYERYFEEAGVRFHHILDPRTGASPAAMQSVTIIAPDGLTSEGLSKSVFVLGVERGLQLVEAHKDVDAVVVDAAGVLHYSSGLRNRGTDGTQGGL
jgi:thiamine biosynthesis lipoprotein